MHPQPDPTHARRLAIGARVRALRLDRQLSQERLGDLAGADNKTIHRIEYASSDPTLSLLLRIADALDTDLADLLRT